MLSSLVAPCVMGDLCGTENVSKDDAASAERMLKRRVSELEEANAALAAENDALKKENASLKAKLAAEPQPSEAPAPIPAVPAAPPAAPAAPAPTGDVDPGELLGTLPDVSFLSPRGKYAAAVHEHALVLSGKSSRAVVPYAHIGRAWELDGPAGGGAYLALSLTVPAQNGKAAILCVSLLAKPTDGALSAQMREGAGAEPAAKTGSAPALLAAAIGPRLGDGAAMVGNGAFKPRGGCGAIQCYLKATEVALYLLDAEILVKEGGKVHALQYAALRAEVLPPSGRRTFDLQLEGAKTEGVSPLRIELTMIEAAEYERVFGFLKKTKANVNGSRDAHEGGEEEESEEEEEDSDDDDDEDFAPMDESEPEEEYDAKAGADVPVDDDDDDDDDDDGDDGDDAGDDGEEAVAADGDMEGGGAAEEEDDDDDDGKGEEEPEEVESGDEAVVRGGAEPLAKRTRR